MVSTEKITRRFEMIERFLSRSHQDILARFKTESPAENAMGLFREVAKHVPAYEAMLAQCNIQPEDIQTVEDFHQKLPILNKQNYILTHPLSDLCWYGRLEGNDMVSVSSGSTGQPTFWPRTLEDEFDITTRYEQVMIDSFGADTQRTLAVVCFALGTWVGGMWTVNNCRFLGMKGYPITTVTPGNNKTEIFRIMRDLAPEFDQVVLLGYPPFLKDVVDSGLTEDEPIPWNEYNLKLITSGELFSEEWRTIMGLRTRSMYPFYDSAALYGTADVGVVGNETPISIAIRRFFAMRPHVGEALFGERRLPTLVQYDPMSRYLECNDEGELIVTAATGVPLIRYNLLDKGGIVSYKEMMEFLKGYDFDPLMEMDGAAPDYVANRGFYELPFVYVFGRDNFSLSYFGANLYPETVQIGLEQASVRDWLTGRFVMEVVEDMDHNRLLTIHCEVSPQYDATMLTEQKLPEVIAHSVHLQLLRLNSEFANYVPAEFQVPIVHLCPVNDPEFFPTGVKHRYTR